MSGRTARAGPSGTSERGSSRREVDGFTINPSGNISIVFKNGEGSEVGAVPEDFAYLTYAYHLSNKDETERAPMGFVEFYNVKGDLLRRIENRWIVIEDASRRTTGEYPKIRLRMERKDIKDIIVTRTVIVLQGSPTE